MTARTFTFTVQAAGRPYAIPSAGQYREISSNTPLSVAPQATKDYYAGSAAQPPYWGQEGPLAMMDLWTSGTFAPDLGTEGSYVAWGGGHNGYYGNEVYRFDVATGLWSRMGEPSMLTPNPAYPAYYSAVDANGAFSDGKPCPPHTYQTLGYISPANGGGANGSLVQATLPACDQGGGSRTAAWWRFNYATGLWSIWFDATTIPPGNLTQRVMAQEPNGAHWWLGAGYLPNITRVTQAGVISKYNVGINTGTYFGAGIVPGPRILAGFGDGGQLFLVNLAALEAGLTGTSALKYVSNTGTKGNDSDGLVWCPDRNAFASIPSNAATTIRWLTPSNAADPWNSTWTWTTESMVSGDGTTPGLIGNGAYSRFVYAPSIKCFLRASIYNRKMVAYRPLGV